MSFLSALIQQKGKRVTVLFASVNVEHLNTQGVLEEVGDDYIRISSGIGVIYIPTVAIAEVLVQK